MVYLFKKKSHLFGILFICRIMCAICVEKMMSKIDEEMIKCVGCSFAYLIDGISLYKCCDKIVGVLFRVGENGLKENVIECLSEERG